MTNPEEILAQISERLEQTGDDVRELTDDFARLQSEILMLRAAILKHMQSTNNSREGATSVDRELHSVLQQVPRTDPIRKALLLAEAARTFATSGREGEEQNKRALLAALQEYESAQSPSAESPSALTPNAQKPFAARSPLLPRNV